MDRFEIQKGIEVYAAAQAIIGEKLLENGGSLTRDEFDAIFSWYPGAKRLAFPLTWYEPHSFIIGGCAQGDLAKWLDLTQHMCLAGLIHEEFDENRRVIYCMNDDG